MESDGGYSNSASFFTVVNLHSDFEQLAKMRRLKKYCCCIFLVWCVKGLYFMEKLNEKWKDSVFLFCFVLFPLNDTRQRVTWDK